MDFLYALWGITKEAAPYLLLGLLFAAIIKTFLKDELIQKHIGENNWKAVLKSALFGVPLPLCSCGVIPTAISLRKQGASKGATSAFLISTPESGIDSISISYALLDPVLTVIRPLAGFITATIAGITETFFPDEKDAPKPITESPLIQIDGLSKPTEEAHKSCCSTTPKVKEKSLSERLKEGMRYSFIKLMGDISYTLAIGLVLATAITFFIPDSFFQMYLSDPILSMFIMLIIGIPMYICATASTPIAAALIMKGLSPGAAIVFLIAGPATNIASLSVLQKELGKATITRYLIIIAIMSLVFGFITDLIYQSFNLPIEMRSASHVHSCFLFCGFDTLLTCIFIGLLAFGIWNEKIKPLFK